MGYHPEERSIENRNYWLKKLPNSLEVAGIKQDNYRIQNHVRDTKTLPVAMQDAVCKKLISLANGKDFLIYAALMSALNICLYKYTGKDSIVVGSPILKKEDDSVPGDNAIAVVNTIDRNLTYREFLLNVRKSLLEDYERQYYPLASLVEDLGLTGADEKCPLFDIALAFEGLHYEMPDVKNDITLCFAKDRDSLSGQAVFDGNLYNEGTIKTFLGYFMNILESALDNTGTAISEFSIFSPEETEQFLSWNETKVEYNSKICVHQLFEEQARKTPDETAVVCGQKRISYAELDTKSSQLARYLRKLGVGPNRPVGICAEPSIEMVTGLLGILKAGGAYVPVDAKYPKDRISFMLKDANPDVVISQSHLAGLLDDVGAKILFLDAEWSKIDDGAGAGSLLDGIAPENMAYIIYTSGSTGKPKGSGVYQSGWTNLLNWFIKEFDISSRDKVLLISSFSFDLTQKNIFAPIIAGGELHIPVAEYYDPGFILKTISEQRITLLNCTPSAFYPLADMESFEKLASIRYLFLGGEPISLARLKKWTESKDFSARIVNTYGPTECTDICAFHIITDNEIENTASVPIGKPVYNTRLYILNKNNDRVPVGMPGELCIAGDGVGTGYINDAALTREKFIVNPWGKSENELLYKTGDFVSFLPDGNIQYIGRMDHQVKIRGFRIEPGEIESVIKQHSAVQDAVILVRESSSGDKRLEAFIVPDQQNAPVVKKLAALERNGLTEQSHTYELPNGMTVFHLNRTETEFVYREIFEEQAYLQEGIVLEEGSTILDIGANIGMFSLFAHKMCNGKATIYTFEPLDPIYQVLEKNMELYGTDAKIFKCGLSDAPRYEDLTYYPNVSIMSGRYADSKEDHENIKIAILHEMSMGGSTVELSEKEIDELVAERLRSEVYHCELKTISGVIEENGIKQIDLLKIDVEKSELDILNGISGDDWKKIHQIVLELHDIDGRLHEVKSLLESKGYRVSYCKDSKLEDNEIYNLYAVLADAPVSKSVSYGEQAASKQWYGNRSMTEDIKGWMKERLPEYMMPSNFVVIDSIPLTPNGKIDREALLEYGKEHQQVKETVTAPRNPFEETIAKVWEEVLDVKNIDINDNFLELGGHSLLATAIISRLRKIYKVEVPIFQFFENPTISELAVVFKELIESK